MAILHEHTHWILLLSSFLVADTCHGEKPSVPKALLSVSGNGTHPVITHTMNIISFLEFLSSTPRREFCSPLVTQSILFYLERWTGTYMFFSAREYQRVVVSQQESAGVSALQAAFGRDGDGNRVLEMILALLSKNLQVA